jgi:hypothetical protein
VFLFVAQQQHLIQQSNSHCLKCDSSCNSRRVGKNLKHGDLKVILFFCWQTQIFWWTRPTIVVWGRLLWALFAIHTLLFVSARGRRLDPNWFRTEWITLWDAIDHLIDLNASIHIEPTLLTALIHTRSEIQLFNLFETLVFVCLLSLLITLCLFL